MATKAIYPGSFDPIHRGHLDIAAAAAKEYGKCIIAVGVNDTKTVLFDAPKRVEIAKEAVRFYQTYYAKDEHLDIEVISYQGYTVDAAIEYGCTHIVRGTRGAADDDNEKRLYYVNQKLLKIRFREDIEQVLFKASEQYSFISSSDAKKLCAGGQYILAMSYVLPPTHNELMKIYLERDFHQAFRENWWQGFAKHFEGRAYHNLSHIAYMINRLNIYHRQGAIFENILFLRQAIFYHDIKETEEASAEEIPGVSQRHRDMVMATKHLDGKPQNLSGDAQVIHDLDLAILFDEDNYTDYMFCVREENLKCSKAAYIEGRTAVLDRLIESIDYGIFPSEKREKAISLMKAEKAVLKLLP